MKPHKILCSKIPVLPRPPASRAEGLLLSSLCSYNSWLLRERKWAQGIGHSGKQIGQKYRTLKKKRTLGKVLQTTAQIPGQIESPPALLVKASYQYYSQRQDILHIFPPLKCIRDGFRFHLMYSSQCFCLPHYEIRDFLSLCFHSCHLYCFVAAPRAFLSPF